MEVGLQDTTAADISCPAVEATTQGVGMANAHLYGLDTCNNNNNNKTPLVHHYYTALGPHFPEKNHLE